MSPHSSRNHVFLTRFNVPSEGVESLIRARPEWLVHRVRLFETYCLPSMQAQMRQHFHWIIYFDTESPDWLRQRIEEWQHFAPLHPIYRARVSYEERIADIRKVVGHPAEQLLTTNLDNDDGLALDFVERMATFTGSHPASAVYFRYGLIKTPTRLYLQSDPSNAFCSVLEPWGEHPRTCWAAAHNELGRQLPQVVLDGPPGWLQVVHGNNVSNRAQGQLVGPKRYLHRFVGLGTLAEPRKRDLLLDRLVGAPRRQAAIRFRRAVKAVVLRVGGREGSEGVKVVWYKLRRTLGPGSIG